MKTLFLYILLMSSATLFAQFEGTIETHVIANNVTSSVTWSIGKNAVKLHFQFSNQGNNTVADIILSKEDDRMLVLTSTNDSKTFAYVQKDQVSSTMDLANLSFTSIENNNKLGAEFIGQNKDYVSKVWMNDLDINLQPFTDFLRDDPAMILIEKQGVKGFPAKSILTDHFGSIRYSMTVVKVVEKQFADDHFSIPEGYVETALTLPSEK